MVGASGLATKTTRLIHIAATHHQYDLVEELVAANADPYCQHDGRVTALKIAEGSSNPKLRDWAMSYGRLLSTYQLTGNKVHESATCFVIFATDLQDTPVALKFMKNKEEWQREIDTRTVNDTTKLDSTHVLNICTDNDGKDLVEISPTWNSTTLTRNRSNARLTAHDILSLSSCHRQSVT